LTVEDTIQLKVVFIDHVARLSGGEIALSRLLKALDRGIEAHVILGEDGPLVEVLREAGATVEVMAMDSDLRDVRRAQAASSSLNPVRLLSLARYVWRLSRRIRELKADVVHTNSLKAALYGGLAGRLARVPVLWHIRDRIASDYLPRPAVAMVRLASRIVPNGVVANSAATLATLPRQRRATVIYNSSGLSRPVVHDIAPVLAQSPGSLTGPLRIGVMGRLAPWKGQDVFLRAFAEAFPGGSEEAWLIGSPLFGEEDYAESLKPLADDLGIADRVVWRGFRKNVEAELGKLDVLVHCSITPEPFGQVVVEGMAAGLPVIAAAAGGPVEIIRHGVDGLLTTPGDVHALASAMRELASSEAMRTTLGEAGKVAARRFSPEATRESMLSSYASLLSGARAR
jgi:glycosyltransferase involved in cell wall biosynthesis